MGELHGATSSSSSDDATSSPDDAVLASSEERGGEEASECMTNEVATMIGSSEDTASSLASPRRPFLETYWDSPEAKLLFRPLASESTALDAIDNQIKALRDVNKSSNAFLTVAGNLDELNEDDVTEHQKWVIQQKAQYLALALHLARENMNGWTWQKCCEKTIGELQRQGLTLATRHETVSKWYRSFRETRTFVIPQPAKKNLPPFLHQNPDICTNIKEYARGNLDTLSIKMLSDFIHDKVLPILVMDLFDSTEKSVRAMMANNKEQYNKQLRIILKRYGLTCISPSTVYRWMVRLGFRYEPTRKGYYVDGHERPATVQYRWDFCQRYLSYERRMHCWVQVTEPVAAQLETDEMLPKGSGYSYLNSSGDRMREYHVDSFEPEKSKALLQQLVTTDFGGNLSVRFDSSLKPLIIFGHDECIFKQFLMPSKQWYGPNRETFIRPKDDGLGIMISAFQSREFGFGLDTTESDLSEVNRRRQGVKYRDTQAAMDTRKTEYKEPLTTSPFIRESTDKMLTATGHISTWCCSLRIAWTSSMSSIHSTTSYSYSTTPVVTIDNERTG
ncbi:hypothetical protein MHU86_20903 [Fragilaria crotonensis]|nr:hypothetical protein MHU86_20903 [Fragilaria crotonensis]